MIILLCKHEIGQTAEKLWIIIGGRHKSVGTSKFIKWIYSKNPMTPGKSLLMKLWSFFPWKRTLVKNHAYNFKLRNSSKIRKGKIVREWRLRFESFLFNPNTRGKPYKTYKLRNILGTSYRSHSCLMKLFGTCKNAWCFIA